MNIARGVILSREILFCADVHVGTAGPREEPVSEGPAFGLDVGVTNLRLAFADSMAMRPEVRSCPKYVRVVCTWNIFGGGRRGAVGAVVGRGGGGGGGVLLMLLCASYPKCLECTRYQVCMLLMLVV